MAPAHALHRIILPIAIVSLLAAASAPVAAQQSFGASFENDSINGYDEPVNGTLTVTGHTGEVTVRSRNLTDETLARMFDGRATGDGVRVDVPDDGNLTVAFPPTVRCSPDRYAFTVTDGERRANASVNVAVPAITPASFDATTYTVPAGESARIPVRIEGCHDGNLILQIGSQNSSVDAAVTFASNSSRDTVGNVTIDTGNLTGPDSLDVGPGLVRRGWSVHGIPEDGAVPVGTYDLVLHADGEEYDISILRVEGDSSATVDDGTATADSEDGTESRSNGTTTDAERSPLDMPGFGFTGGLLAVLASLALVNGDD